MPTLNDLKKEQIELLDELYWMDEQDNEEKDYLDKKLSTLYLSVESKLNFLSGLLREARDISDARAEALDRAKARLKTSENVQKRLNDFIKLQMQSFGIKKIKGDLCNITLCEGRERTVLLWDEKERYEFVDFNYSTYLPEDCCEVIEVTGAKIDRKALLQHLQNGETFPGVELVKEPYLLVK